ncbi:MFS monocarboxylate [Colletotrichum chrysophilum]|uniref:MFS monocarboxylate n=1 Tax=Colletotrichum chrysophilum TaxID=1836956 RepID=A0AAD9AQR0_9PEZI|nr:MFS monocarboxylate [Colletotrichum chrysophilum]
MSNVWFFDCPNLLRSVMLCLSNPFSFVTVYFCRVAQRSGRNQNLVSTTTMLSTRDGRSDLAPADKVVNISPVSAENAALENEGLFSDDDLPPRDRGRAAWTSLVAVSAIAMATWGFGATQGVFREYYFKTPPFEGNQLVASTGLLVVNSFGAPNIAAAGLSPIFSVLLKRFGRRTTLIGWTSFAAVIISLGIICVRSRRDSKAEVAAASQQPYSMKRIFKKSTFWLFVLSMTLQSLGNNLPANYLPSFATDLGVSPEKGALLVTFLSLFGIIGQISIGALTDAIGPLVPMLMSTLVSSFAVFVVWGLGKYYWNMVVTSILFGAFAFSFMVLRSHMATVVVDDPNRPSEELFVSGILLFTRGVIGVASGYIAAAVLQNNDHIGVQPGYGAGKWRDFIILVGTTITAATVGAIGLWKRRR